MKARQTRDVIPILQIRHSEGKDWCVAATWPDGRLEEIAGFKNEADANAWIAEDFLTWLEGRKRSEKVAEP